MQTNEFPSQYTLAIWTSIGSDNRRSGLHSGGGGDEEGGSIPAPFTISGAVVGAWLLNN